MTLRNRDPEHQTIRAQHRRVATIDGGGPSVQPAVRHHEQCRPVGVDRVRTAPGCVHRTVDRPRDAWVVEPFPIEPGGVLDVRRVDEVGRVAS
jgi:hypothetical protein